MDRILGSVKIVLSASSATPAPFVVSSSFWVAKNMACSRGDRGRLLLRITVPLVLRYEVSRGSLCVFKPRMQLRCHRQVVFSVCQTGCHIGLLLFHASLVEHRSVSCMLTRVPCRPIGDTGSHRHL